MNAIEICGNNRMNGKSYTKGHISQFLTSISDSKKLICRGSSLKVQKRKNDGTQLMIREM